MLNMSPQTAMPWLSGVLVASVAGMVIGGRLQQLGIVLTAAGLFASAVVAVSIAANAPLWRDGRLVLSAHDEAVIALRRNARLIAMSYGWGALAMQALYTTPLTGLRWQHGWQYALAMLLLAIGSYCYARGLDNAEHQHTLIGLGAPLTIANSLLAAGGLVFLVGSGKLLLWRADWAANQVFLFGALILMVLSAIALKTHARLTQS